LIKSKHGCMCDEAEGNDFTIKTGSVKKDGGKFKF
jgi:hypothetical protein